MSERLEDEILVMALYKFTYLNLTLPPTSISLSVMTDAYLNTLNPSDLDL